MSSSRLSRIVSGALAVATVAIAAQALAREAGSHRRERGCIYDCREGGKECLAPIHEEIRACRQAECADEHAAAREACEANRDSDECAAAREAAKACAGECREPLADEAAACHDETLACIESCPDAPPVASKDRACVKECATELRTCAQPAHEAAQECRAGCSELKQQAREACAADRHSDECHVARRAAHACIVDCREDAAAALAPCREAFNDCVVACPDAE